MTIHPTAIIHKSAELDSSVIVGPYAIIHPLVKIGKGTVVESHAVIDERTTIAENNTIGSFSIIGGKPQDLKYHGEPSTLEIGSNNSIREYTTINRGTEAGGGITKIGSNCLLMAYCHVAHDAEVHNHIIMANSTQIAGHTILEDYVRVGGCVTIVQFLRIGKHAYIGAGSIVDRDLAPYCAAYGNRLKMKGVNIVGLKRTGMKEDDIRKIMKSFKIFFESNQEKKESLAQIEKEFPNQSSVQYFVNFIRNSKNGIAQ